MKTDEQLKTDVTSEMEWDPAINATHVGVAVKGGVVTLTGHLETFAEKYAIERAVGRVEGVKAVAIELDVKLAPGHKRSDSEIAEAAEAAFKWHALIPGDRIQVRVEKGRVTLAGELDWEYQRTAAEKAVRPLTGVVSVINNLRLKPSVAPANISNRIRDALARHAEREAKNIEVIVNGSTVTLRGRVDSLAERSAAQGAAWAAPGISLVVNDLTVGSGT
ncbi:BON domain-containing protein [Sphaerotilus montanus]|uniref:Osmotically-inducible protein OsmY n=1 Tax=Sphaerotilus montanus TaxID=522889 RepID=A0A7Y9R225_9BURK|nr:BON domain-containing protein [Sphaerotilus montanus]NYG35328.1 osmotically-inducible protein OsmY [Sphaerotilus montanus]NZD56872.1 BON domain-containing protein [Sphaerotilus montanus]